MLHVFRRAAPWIAFDDKQLRRRKGGRNFNTARRLDMLRFGIVSDTGFTRVGSPETLELTMSYLAVKNAQGAVESFRINMNVITGEQGAVPLCGAGGINVSIDASPVLTGAQSTNLAPNHENDINIKQVFWDLDLTIQVEQGTPGEYSLIVTGPVVYNWILGEVDLDPSALPSVNVKR